MSAPYALEMVLEKVAAPSREQLRKTEKGLAKRLGKRGAFRRQLKHKTHRGFRLTTMLADSASRRTKSFTLLNDILNSLKMAHASSVSAECACATTDLRSGFHNFENA